MLPAARRPFEPEHIRPQYLERAPSELARGFPEACRWEDNEEDSIGNNTVVKGLKSSSQKPYSCNFFVASQDSTTPFKDREHLPQEGQIVLHKGFGGSRDAAMV